ncbi:MAG: tetratricopeptide repeat protein, partial [Gemmataceae bacterium]
TDQLDKPNRNGVAGVLRKSRPALERVSDALAVLVHVSAGPRVPPIDLVREGNIAFDQQDFELAVRYYTEAEEYITDPGLVSFNKAAALYRLGRYTEAEQHYRRCLPQAGGTRLAHVLYNLGNACLQQAQPDDYDFYDKAIEAYVMCLDVKELDPKLRENVEHNLQLAQTLRARVKPRDTLSNPNPDKPDPPDPMTGRRPMGSGDDLPKEKANPKGTNKKAVQGEKGKEGGAGNDDQHQTGSSNTLPPIPDEEKLAPMERAEALSRLKGWADRIVAERIRQQHNLAPKVENVRDW